MTSVKQQILDATREERIKDAQERAIKARPIGQKNRGDMTAYKQINGSGYFSQPNVKMYQEQMLQHLFGEKPNSYERNKIFTFFESPEEMNKNIMEYFKLCMDYEVVPTVSGLCAYLKCDYQTLLRHANNENSNLYESCRTALNYLHMCVENGATESKLNSVAYIFQGKNYFNMSDTQDFRVTAGISTDMNTTETLKALQLQKDKELMSLQTKPIKCLEAKVNDPMQESLRRLQAQKEQSK